MKVAVVTVATNTIPRFRIDMIDEFVRRGCEVVVFGDEPENEWNDYFTGHAVRYRQFPVSRNGLNPLDDLATIRKLESLMKSESPSKVFTYQAKGNLYGAIAAHRAGIQEIYLMIGGLGSVFNAQDMKSHFVSRIVTMGYQRAVAYASKVFFQNGEDAKRFKDIGIVNDSKIVMTHGSGVNLDQFPSRSLPKDQAFLFVGRLVRGKGIADFLEAARMVKEIHPEVRFEVVGPFDSNPTCITEAEMESYVEDGTVVYHGLQQNVQPFYARCSCFVLPSYYGEGTPKSALEAMATGRPLIVADAVGCREVVTPGANGFLVSPKDPVALAAAMLELVEDVALAQQMAATSRHMAEEVFDVRKVNDAICCAMGLVA